MALKEPALRKLGKEEIIKLALEYQSKFESTLSSINDIKTDLSELRKYYEKLESDVIITKQVNINCATKWSFWSVNAERMSNNPGVNAWRYPVFQNLLLLMIMREKFWNY